MPGVFSRRGAARPPKANPMAAKLAGVVPAVTEPAAEQAAAEQAAVELAAVEQPAAEQAAAELAAVAGPAPASAPPDADRRSVARSAPRSAAIGLAAAVPVPASAPALFALPAGYNLPTPDPFARNRQRVGRRFGEVVVTEGTVLLRLRRKRVGRLLPPITLRPDEVVLVSPTETDFIGNHRGVVLERPDGEHLYVWVDEPGPLLTVLSIHGFPVGEQPVPVTRAG